MIKKLLLITVICVCFSCGKQSHQESKIIKIALREVGDKLLLSNYDSTSVVKPIVALDNNTYQITFEKPLVIQPDSLVNIVKTSFNKANLSEHYITEVLQCNANEVAYSYAIKLDEAQSLVPCSGRELQKACYTIQISFTKPHKTLYYYLKYLIPLAVLIFAFLIFRKTSNSTNTSKNSNFKAVGGFKFYQDQNKLIRETIEITLSKKECELLAIFVACPNKIIKREELTKRVWEDNGVIVGRSLDTYISKLRKKLQSDATIKLTNIHGVGYKLEIV